MSVHRLALTTLASMCVLTSGLSWWASSAQAATGAAIRDESVSNAASTSVTLEAQIDPQGSPTTYYFQYGATLGYGTDVPALSESAPRGTPVGSGEGYEEVAVHVQALQVATTYHYRVVAVTELAPGVYETVDGRGQEFTTEVAGGELTLPDGRSWEMVSPPSKQGALIVPLGSFLLEGLNVEASTSGDALVYMTNTPPEAAPAGTAGGDGISVLATRGSSEWTSQTIALPHEEGTGPSEGNASEYRFFAEDLSLGLAQVFGNFDRELSPEATEQTPYIRKLDQEGNVNARCTSSCYEPLLTSADTLAGTPFGGTEPSGVCASTILCGAIIRGATPDLSHVVLRSKAALAAPAVENGLYEWADGKVQIVSVLPAAEGGAAVPGELGNGPQQQDWQRAISDDGSRVIWRSGEESADAHLYLRDTTTDETIRLDLPQGGMEESSESLLVAASSDLSKIFFLDSGRLTANSTSAFRDPDLYEYNLNAPEGSRLTDLTPGVNGGGEEGQGVQGVLGVSEDGSYVYYAMHGEIFEYHEGKSTFIAKPEAERDWTGPLTSRPVRVSPNGRWLAFQSPADLTGYDTRDAISGEADEEVYLYNGETHKLVCASCNPTGARPVGRQLNDEAAANVNNMESGVWVSAVIPPWSRSNLGEGRYQSRYLSNNGRLFFDSNEALVPQDVNGTIDVYEYEPPGEGTCTSSSVTFSERSGGCVGIISSGTSAQESTFMDASQTGSDVFFITSAGLLPQDVDTAYDIYDAHECTGAAPCYPTATAQPPACNTSESCKAAESPQPAIFGSPSSETFSGAGNIAPTQQPAVAKRSLTRAQKLAKALTSCHKKRKRAKRMACERRARKQYGGESAPKAKTSIRDRSAARGR